MSRPIKFRVWDERSRKWFDMSHLGLHQDGIEVSDPGVGYVIIKDGYCLEQFTGLRDKNGVDIYEGDIVQADYGLLAIVAWDEEWVGWSTNYLPNNVQYTRGRAYADLWGTYQVIGNIHQNPELTQRPTRQHVKP